jgi:D-alanyl-lipoteichoic acid acyltransferase DltB (MBOAT superfamily)
MLFNSFAFLFFLPVVFLLYWIVCGQNLRRQNILIVLASYFFYGWWDWWFLGLIAFSSVCAWFFGVMCDPRGFNFCGMHFHHGEQWKHWKRWSQGCLLLSFVVNLGILGFFKYFNFFATEAEELLKILGFRPHIWTLKILLPVGISFYTFQALSYTIDVYRKSIAPTRDLIAFLAYVSYFPQLVAGPIERATNLLPQILAPKRFNYPLAVDGCRQMLWGYFKKMAVADACAPVINQIFDQFDTLPGSVLLMGACFFAFQIYGDFSGYSDIAIGCSKLFGIRLMRNFNYPYFARDVAEFWRRWHISLSTWFRDYLYIPLGGSRCSRSLQIRNTFVIFLISGFWHGANWTFLIWGALHAAYFIPLLLTGRNRRNLGNVATGRLVPSFRDLVCMGTTFFFVCLAWIFFRSSSVHSALVYIGRIFSLSLFTLPHSSLSPVPVLMLFVLVEWIQREKQHALELDRLPRAVRWAIYCAASVFSIAVFRQSSEFIYFQF